MLPCQMSVQLSSASSASSSKSETSLENMRNSSLVLKMNTDRPLNIRSLSQKKTTQKNQHFTESRKHLRLSHPEQKAPLYSCLFPPPDGNGKRRQRSLNTCLSNMQQFQVWGFLGLAAHKTLVHEDLFQCLPPRSLPPSVTRAAWNDRLCRKRSDWKSGQKIQSGVTWWSLHFHQMKPSLFLLIHILLSLMFEVQELICKCKQLCSLKSRICCNVTPTTWRPTSLNRLCKIEEVKWHGMSHRWHTESALYGKPHSPF